MKGVAAEVSPLVWGLTIAAIVGLLLFDFVFHVRKAHAPTLREAAIWSGIYVGLALLFGVGVLVFGGTQAGSEYFAGYVTEKALSVDNLFVFLIIMNSFRVPREDQQKVLLFGIVFSLIARTGFIFLGAALINAFAWVFYLFGLVLLLTAGNMIKPEGEESHSGDNVIIRLARKVFHTTDHYDGDKLFTVVHGRRAMTPMLLVMVAIGGTDILFALDSIPAIFGLTQNVFIVFTATAFSLLGLRQLFFLIDGLLDRLIYLSYGLAGILGFIGVKLVLHALHENSVPFINDGAPVPVVEISTGLSLSVILGVLVVTVAASLLSPAGKAHNAIANARRHVMSYLDSEYTADPVERERIFGLLLTERDQIVTLGPRYRQKVRDEPALMASSNAPAIATPPRSPEAMPRPPGHRRSCRPHDRRRALSYRHASRVVTTGSTGNSGPTGRPAMQRGPATTWAPAADAPRPRRSPRRGCGARPGSRGRRRPEACSIVRVDVAAGPWFVEGATAGGTRSAERVPFLRSRALVVHESTWLPPV